MMRVLLLVLFALFMSVPGISTMPPVDRDEPRYLQATKQMVASGDFIDIRFQDETRYKKPIGIYWLQSAVVTAAGQGEATPIWVYRLVSTLAFVIAVLATFWTGRALFGPRAGLVAAVVMAGILGLAYEGRIAKTDAMLVALTLVAQGAIAQVHLAARTNASTPSWLPWVFWIAQGWGILVKGPITLLASVLTILALSAYERDWRWILRLKPLRGGLLTSLIVLPWLILITWKSGGAFLEESVGRDLLGKVAEGQESHGFPPGYFTVTYSLFFWPFGAMAIGAGLAAINGMRDHPGLRFCLAWYIPFWLVFEAIPTKLPHYTLPAYPALALLIGWAATLPASSGALGLRTWQTWLWRAAAFGLIVATAVIVVLALAAPLYLTGDFFFVGIPIALAACLAAALGLSRGTGVSLTRILGASASAGVAYALFFGVFAPALAPIWLSPRIEAAVVNYRPCPNSTLAAVGYHEPSLVFLAGTATELTNIAGAARHLAADPACALALVPKRGRNELDALLAAQGKSIAFLTGIDGINFSSGDAMRLELLRVAP